MIIYPKICIRNSFLPNYIAYFLLKLYPLVGIELDWSNALQSFGY